MPPQADGWRQASVGVDAGFLLGEGLQEPRDAKQVDHALQIVGPHGQAEFPAHLGEAFEQEVRLVYGAFHGAEGVLRKHRSLAVESSRLPHIKIKRL